jgi:hypothetical protein
VPEGEAIHPDRVAAEGKLGHAVGGASKELLQSESVRVATNTKQPDRSGFSLHHAEWLLGNFCYQAISLNTPAGHGE